MIIVPFRVSRDEFILFVVLEDENLKRIIEYDPAQVKLDKFPRQWDGLRLKNVLIGYGSPREVADLKLCNDPEAMQRSLNHLSRGFEFKPEAGSSRASHA